MQSKGFTEAAIATGLVSVFSSGAFGAFGAMVHYLYLIVKDEMVYSTAKMIAFLVMGFFVGVVIDQLTISFLGESYPGVILISGFLFLRILEFVDSSGFDLIIKRLKIK